MRGSRTPLHLAAEAKALYDSGLSRSAVAHATGLPLHTVDTILYGRSHYVTWQALPTTEAYREARERNKLLFQTAMGEITRQALVQIERKLPDASAKDAAIVLGIVQDKERLIAGESTQNIAISAKVDIEHLDALALKLAQALLPKPTLPCPPDPTT